MKEVFVVKQEGFMGRMIKKLSSDPLKDKPNIQRLTITDLDIILEGKDSRGIEVRTIIPICGIKSNIKECDLQNVNSLIQFEYTNHLGLVRYCKFSPNFVPEKDKSRLIRCLKLIGVIKIDILRENNSNN